MACKDVTDILLGKDLYYKKQYGNYNGLIAAIPQHQCSGYATWLSAHI